MIGSTVGLEVLGLSILVLFAVVMVAGLQLSRRAEKRNLREINAATAWAQLGERPAAGMELLYGVWQTAMHEVVLVVRDEQDLTLGTITQRASGTTIELGTGRFVVVTTSGTLESAELIGAGSDPAATPMCRFEARGWGGRRVASYATPASGTFTIGARWAWARQRGALPVSQDGRAIGRMLTLGGPAFNRGRALLLPADLPLPLRLFMLWKGVGVQGRSAAR
ncbi:MAG: hypothetical protein ABI129_03195 [Rhodanobacter sp.]